MGVNLATTNGVSVGVRVVVASTKMTLGPKKCVCEQRNSRVVIKKYLRNCHDRVRRVILEAARAETRSVIGT